MGISPRKIIRRHTFGVLLAEHVIETAYPKWARAWRFLLTGGLITVLFYCILVPLADGLHVPYRVAATLAFIPSFLINFHLQRTWVFLRDATEKRNLHFTLMLVKYILLFLMSMEGVEYFSTHYGIWYLPLQIASTIISVFVSPVISWLIVRI